MARCAANLVGLKRRFVPAAASWTESDAAAGRVALFAIYAAAEIEKNKLYTIFLSQVFAAFKERHERS